MPRVFAKCDRPSVLHAWKRPRPHSAHPRDETRAASWPSPSRKDAQVTPTFRHSGLTSFATRRCRHGLSRGAPPELSLRGNFNCPRTISRCLKAQAGSFFCRTASCGRSKKPKSLPHNNKRVPIGVKAKSVVNSSDQSPRRRATSKASRPGSKFTMLLRAEREHPPAQALELEVPSLPPMRRGLCFATATFAN